MDTENLRNIAYQCLLELATDEGINASGKDEIYGCIFGRDSAITVLKILKSLSNIKDGSDNSKAELIKICRRTLVTLSTLQGKEINIESGEEPGKFIHEYRKDKYDHLITRPVPWYIYPDKTLKNYDSIDATPLGLIAIHDYFTITKDQEFINQLMPHVEQGLMWLLTYADSDQDELIEYEFKSVRKYGGLKVQSWTDSRESLRQSDGKMPVYPIAPVEAQGYAWLAFKIWSDFYADKKIAFHNKTFSATLSKKASLLKKKFNEYFLFINKDLVFPAQALDGLKNQINTVTGNPLLLLWASYKKGEKVECIIDDKYIPDIVKRTFMPDLFDPDAGLRTMSSESSIYNPKQDSYHNGSFWPKLNGMSHGGLVKWGFKDEAAKLKFATLKPLIYFGTPIELYIKGEDGTYLEYKDESGQVSCKKQAWSAAITLDLLSS